MRSDSYKALWRRYRAAYRVYQRHASVLDERLRTGAPVSDADLQSEEQALHTLTEVRRDLIEAISAEIRR